MKPFTAAKTQILAVDDQESITTLWRIMLEKTGRFVVHEENRSLFAVEAIRRLKPDLLLLDIDMPGMDGADIARLIQSDEEIGRTAIVFVSSLVSQLEAERGKRVEGCRCVSKPTGVRELIGSIDQTLQLQSCAASA